MRRAFIRSFMVWSFLTASMTSSFHQISSASYWCHNIFARENVISIFETFNRPEWLDNQQSTDARFITKHIKACPQMASTTVSSWHGCYTQVHAHTHTYIHPTMGKSLSVSMPHDKPTHTTTSCAKRQYNIRLSTDVTFEWCIHIRQISAFGQS